MILFSAQYIVEEYSDHTCRSLAIGNTLHQSCRVGASTTIKVIIAFGTAGIMLRMECTSWTMTALDTCVAVTSPMGGGRVSNSYMLM